MSYMVLEDVADHQIRYVPNAHANTDINPRPSLSVRAWDRYRTKGRRLRAEMILIKLI